MTQGRWDVRLHFLEGPLSRQEDLIRQGPVIRIGADPGPDGLKLDGYRGIDDRCAVITAYDGGDVRVAPVGPSQVRVAPHEHVDWNNVRAISAPTWLADGCAVHLGPPGRGVTFVFVGARPLGAWASHRLVSEASQAGTVPAPSEVRVVEPWRRVPWWSIPALLVLFCAFSGSLGTILFVARQRAVVPLGPEEEGTEETFWDAALDEAADTRLAANLSDGFHAFIMAPNLAAAGDATLEDPARWDKGLMDWVARHEKGLARQTAKWRKFESVRAEYVYVLERVRAAGLPDVLAAIPFDESGYTANAKSPVCAFGWWQLMPETAIRGGARVEACSFRGGGATWTPDRLAPPINAYKNAYYVKENRCLIESCAVDERMDLQVSTAASMKLLGEAYGDPDLRSSGAVVQLTIASHNAGFDDAPYRNGVRSMTQVRPAYVAYRNAIGATSVPDFVGRNITCDGREKIISDDPNNRCNGFLAQETQQYVPAVIARHLLAVCYYGTNHAGEAALQPYVQYTRPGGYCDAFTVPERAALYPSGAPR